MLLYRNMFCIWLTERHNLNRSSHNVIEFVIICKYIYRLVVGASSLGNVLKLKTALNYEIKIFIKVTKKSPDVRPRNVHRKDFVWMIYSFRTELNFTGSHGMSHTFFSQSERLSTLNFLLYCKNFTYHLRKGKKNGSKFKLS